MVQTNSSLGFPSDSGAFALGDFPEVARTRFSFKNELSDLDQLSLLQQRNVYGTFVLFLVGNTPIFRLGRETILDGEKTRAQQHLDIWRDFRTEIARSPLGESPKIIGGAWLLKIGDHVDLFYRSGDLKQRNVSPEQVQRRDKLVKEFAQELITNRFPNLNTEIHAYNLFLTPGDRLP
ncbi:MAG: hypothetical protein KDD62_02710 [Bdellovibrionales bacterium]|nr:hypothetical protein [Bdellovibrionales bacterium]